MDKILIVDDHAENIQLMARILETSFPGIRLFQATNVNTALTLCNKIPFDLIISDWEMPGQTGIDLTRMIKADPRTCHIPVVIVTAIMITPENLNVALTAGAHDYIRSPVEPVELTARVNAALTLARLHLSELRKKDVELVEKSMIHAKYKEFGIRLAKDLQGMATMCSGCPKGSARIQAMIDDLDQRLREDSWKNFEIAFQNIHGDFVKNLIARFPHLTSGEIRLCILLKLGLNTKNMASLLHQTPDSLKVSRSRLRRKLALSEEISFQNYLAAI